MHIFFITYFVVSFTGSSDDDVIVLEPPHKRKSLLRSSAANPEKVGRISRAQSLNNAKVEETIELEPKPEENVKSLVSAGEEENKEHPVSQTQFCAMTFFTDDKKVEFYTGVDSIEKLWLLFRFVEDRIESTIISTNKLPLFEQFCLALIRLRLNLQPKDMAYRFGIELEELVGYITRFFSILAFYFAPTYINWPSREDLKSIRVPGLLDCVSIVELLKVSLSIDFGKEDDDKSLTYLIGFTPAGLVSYVSLGFPSSWKKENIWQKSGILNQLHHDDMVITDGGKTLYKADDIKKIVTPFVENFGLQLVNVDEEIVSTPISVQNHCKQVLDKLKKRFAIFQVIFFVICKSIQI